MATPLGSISSVLGSLLPFFVALFAWVITYAIVSKTKVIGENKNLTAIVSLMAAIFVIALPDVTRMVTLIVPWFFFLFLFLMLVATGFLFVSGGTNFEGIYNALGKESTTWVFIVIGGLIIAFAAASVYGQSLLPLTTGANVSSGGNATTVGSATDTASFRNNLGSTLFNPSILGLAIFFLIATFAIIFLTQEGGTP